MSLWRSDRALGAFYRRLGARVGKAKAITATARKLALLVYRMLRNKIHYQEPSAADSGAQAAVEGAEGVIASPEAHGRHAEGLGGAVGGRLGA